MKEAITTHGTLTQESSCKIKIEDMAEIKQSIDEKSSVIHKFKRQTDNTPKFPEEKKQSYRIEKEIVEDRRSSVYNKIEPSSFRMDHTGG